MATLIMERSQHHRKIDLGDLIVPTMEIQNREPLTAIKTIQCFINTCKHILCLQAHFVYAEITEAKQEFDHLAEDNRKALYEAQESLGPAEQVSIQEDLTEGDGIEPKTQRKDQSEVSDLNQARLQKHEVIQVALECIKTGVTPTITGPISEDNLAALDESVRAFEENFRKSNYLNVEAGKSVGQQLLQLQAELKQVKDENKKIIENYTAERTLRKKYYNMVEDMKGTSIFLFTYHLETQPVMR
ncbi:uncharacterized protein LOC108434466 [Pygocentrus nattereri]|uniref:uncharacterized protein LOC108434466 n=1 Tax=Pygocentrus nattereri TaxID=42514 RepID=UPI0018914566|nr:uncharacterized protein LOC108434466 [Pygocentrus nattereri]